MDRQLMPDAMTFKGRTGWPEEETIQLGHDAVPPTASPPRGRLLFVSHDASRTGAPVALLNILRWLRANDPREMRVILRSAGPLESKFRELAETIVVTDPRSATDLLQEVSLIYSNTGTNGLFLRELEAESIPIITHIHEMPLILESFGRENLEEVIRQTRHYVACSEPVFESLQSHYRIPPGMISLVHEGISFEAVLKGASEMPEEQVRQMNRLDQDTMVIAACGVADCAITHGLGASSFCSGSASCRATSADGFFCTMSASSEFPAWSALSASRKIPTRVSSCAMSFASVRVKIRFPS